MASRRPKGRRKPPPKRARRSLLASRPSLPSLRLELQPHHVDIVALALIAAGVFLAGVEYLHWSGGTLGNGAVHATRFLLGLLGYAIPAAFVAGGALVLIRELRPPSRPMRTGVVCLVAAATLALAAGTLGLGPGAARAPHYWQTASLEQRGGIIGAAELWAGSHLLSTLGAHILAVFLFLAGVILVTGATLASVVRATGASVAGTSRAIRRSTEELAGTVARRPSTDAGLTAAGIAEDSVPVLPPEPDTAELVIRATHVEAPPIEADDDPRERDPDSNDAPVRATEPEHDEQDLTPQGRYRATITDDPEFEWRIPSARFLTRATGEAAKPDTAGQEQVAKILLETLGHFGVEAKVIGRVTGPHITRYELRLAPGTKVAKVAQLKDDLAYALAATEIRILAPIPGKQAVGVEVPNARRRIVHLGDVFQDPPPDWSPLSVWLGKDIAGRAIGADLAKMPHLLVAGTTGAGKSACVNAMLSSILLRATPHQVRFVLVDPKQVELNHYEGIPHLLTPVITSPRMAANALQNLVKEMEQRYGTMSLSRTRSLPELNRAREKRGEPPLPYVLCVIDELADLMMVAPADVEDSIIRLAQKARAVGIHLVLATQSPRVDVITGMIKANVPSRIAFAVSSQTDSRVILDQNGAESLLGQGDMLFSPVGSSKLQRIQGAWIDESEIAQVTDAWRRQGEPEFHEELLEEVESEGSTDAADPEFHPDEDPLLEEAIALVAQMGTASTSMLQRRLRLGYTRAGRLIDMLERRGIISGYEGSKPRQVLITEADVPRILAHLAEATALLRARPGGRARTRSDATPRVAFGPMADIGSTLREARMRARIDITEVETRTKIRAKYLRAMENEEWDLLPGPVYVKSFLRTYGDFLGLDSRMLVDEFKRRYEGPSDHDLRPMSTLTRERERAARGPLLPAWLAVGLVLVAVVVALYALGSLGSSSKNSPSAGVKTQPSHHPHHAAHRKAPAAPKPTTVRLQLVPTGTVYVCLVDGTGKRLIPGRIFAAGQAIPTETSSKMLLTLGNASVQMKVNGATVNVAPSATSIGFLLEPGGHRSLPPSKQPRCA